MTACDVAAITKPWPIQFRVSTIITIIIVLLLHTLRLLIWWHLSFLSKEIVREMIYHWNQWYELQFLHYIA